MPLLGLSPQTGHVSWPETEPATFWSRGQCPTHWAIPARAMLVLFTYILIHRELWLQTLTYSEVKNNLLYLEVSINCRLPGSQSKMPSLHDCAGELQLGGGFPTNYFFHGVSANQPNNLNRPVQKSKERSVLPESAKMGASIQGWCT